MVLELKLGLSNSFLDFAMSLFWGSTPSLQSPLSDLGVRAQWGVWEGDVYTGS